MKEPFFGLTFWITIIVTTVCGFELAMFLYLAGERLMLDGKPLEGHFWAGTNSPVRDALEVGSFVGSFFLFIVAVAALVMTRHQLKESEKVRSAYIYMRISSKWNSHTLVSSRMYNLTLKDQFENSAYADAEKTASTSVQGYIKLKLTARKKTNRLAHSKAVAILTFLEDLGNLCYNNLVDEQYVFEFISAAIVHQMWLLDDYIKDMQGGEPLIYGNAIYLRDGAQKFLDAKERATATPPVPRRP